MDTKATINNLPEVYRKKLDAFKSTKNRIEKENVGINASKEYKDMIRGYLACLLDSGVIKQSDFRKLYIYYATM